MIKNKSKLERLLNEGWIVDGFKGIKYLILSKEKDRLLYNRIKDRVVVTYINRNEVNLEKK